MALAVFLVLDPLAFVLFLVQICDRAFSMLATFVEEANIRSSVIPDFIAKALDFRVAEVTSECLFEVCEVVCALAIEVSVLEVALIITTLMPLVSPVAVFLAI